MPTTLSRLRLSLRHRFAALGIVGALMVLLPLAQVLRYQDNELKSLAAQQAALDPLLLASAAQRAVLDHQPLAAQVLRGQAVAEEPRRAVQARVDERVFHLDMAVGLLGDPRAVQESDALRQDWHGLAQAVQARHTTPVASDASHRLLVEQLLQVVDLLTLGAWTPEAGDAAVRQLAVQTQRLLPRLALGLAALGSPAAPSEVVRAARTLARQFEALAAAAEAAAGHADGGTATAAGTLAAQARQGATAARTLSEAGLGATPSATSAQAQETLQKVHAALPDAVAAVLRPGLRAAEQRVHRQQQLTLALHGLLVLGAALLLHGLWRARVAPPVHAAQPEALPTARPRAAASVPKTAPPPQEATFALLSRLSGPGQPARRPSYSVTLPPED